MRQLWAGGKKVDTRMQMMQSDPFVMGHLVINSVKGRRFATILEYENALPESKELLPRLWSADVVSCQWAGSTCGEFSWTKASCACRNGSAR